MKLTTPRILPLIIFLGAIFCFGESYGQVSSAAFDPNCYFPKIGVSGEIDTIYGAHNDLYLGVGMLNLGPTPDGTSGRLSSALIDPHFASVFTSWPSFNLHQPHVLGRLEFEKGYSIVRLGHFRSPKFTDILCKGGALAPARIYWEDEQGNYDSSRYTELLSSVKGALYNDYSPMAAYTSHISSDSVEDIIYSVFVGNTNTIQDSIYLLYYKGGSRLYLQGKAAYQDSIQFLDRYKEPAVFLFKECQGDFRGVGMNDLLASDAYGNIFYYQNKLPFSMAAVTNALMYDTIYAKWENPGTLYNFQMQELEMHALAKGVGDSSNDFLAFFDTDYGSETIGEIRIFKGGKDFGVNRWTFDSAAFVIHEPYYYDSKYSIGWGNSIKDCGHMTGTNNRLLYVEGSLDGGFYGYHFFYVLGNAIDDKIDMEIGPIPNVGGSSGAIDTLVADNDKLQDVIMGLGAFGLNSGNESNGTIYLIHGSNKIPDRTSSVSARNAVDESPSHILAYPNPCSGHTVLTFDNCSASKMKIQVV
ncbi:MAG: hypothetical protein Q8919_02430, partial [Bacteroidota bacterium]|nr:hypothetical protein [Bacteroidota bacterium]